MKPQNQERTAVKKDRPDRARKTQNAETVEERQPVQLMEKTVRTVVKEDIFSRFAVVNHDQNKMSLDNGNRLEL